jgi:hypothetical protein
MALASLNLHAEGEVLFGFHGASPTRLARTPHYLNAMLLRTRPSGFLGGVQGGCDYQFAGGFVIGVAGDYSWTDADGSHVSPLFPGFINHTKVDSQSLIAQSQPTCGRRGHVAGRSLITWTRHPASGCTAPSIPPCSKPWVRASRASLALLPQRPRHNERRTGAHVHCTRARPRPWRGHARIMPRPLQIRAPT